MKTKHTASGNKPIALVTGGSRGIGLAIAQRLADQGHDLVIVADDETRLAAAAQQLRETDPQPKVHAFTLDLSQRGAVDQLMQQLGDRKIEIDVLCCNAGVGVHGDFVRETDLHAELAMIQLNVVSVVELSKRVAKEMVARNRGCILFTASVAGLGPTPLLGVYGATKAFVFSFAEAMREELRDTKVKVTALCPGPTDTNFFARAGMLGTKTANGPLAKPSVVAEAGVTALMADDDHVVTPFKDRVRMAIGKFLPPPVLAKQGKAT